MDRSNVSGCMRTSVPVIVTVIDVGAFVSVVVRAVVLDSSDRELMWLGPGDRSSRTTGLGV